MNWKKFLAETAAIGAVTTVGLLYAPAFLAAEAGAVVLGAEVGIAALGFWGLTKAWKNLWNEAPQKSKVEKVKAQSQQTKVKQKEKMNMKEREQERECSSRAPRRWTRKPRFFGRWRSKVRGIEKENYRDAA